MKTAKDFDANLALNQASLNRKKVEQVMSAV